MRSSGHDTGPIAVGDKHVVDRRREPGRWGGSFCAKVIRDADQALGDDHVDRASGEAGGLGPEFLSVWNESFLAAC